MRGHEGATAVNKLTIAAVGFDPQQPGEARLPQGLKETGWTLILHPEAHPSENWLRSQPVDLFVVPAGHRRAVELTTMIGRVTAKPVVWTGGNGPDQVPDRFWERIVGRDWPLWGFLPEDAPRWVAVAVCRGLVTAAQRLSAAAEKIQQLERKIEDRKIIERAKGILMDQFDLAESEAYKRLRDTAMRQRKSLREIAQGILAFVDEKER